MNRADLDGITLEYEVQGSGEPVVFIHGAHMVDTYRPLMAEPALKGYKFIGYHRRGYAGSSRPDGALSIAEHAADCLAFLRKLDAVPSHVVGHSSGAIIGIQLALDAPNAVRSLALLEPARLDVPSGAALVEALGASMPMYEAGDKAGAVQ
jgi:pimeloyl-ACP methyl ester carboxylesterase